MEELTFSKKSRNDRLRSACWLESRACWSDPESVSIIMGRSFSCLFVLGLHTEYLTSFPSKPSAAVWKSKPLQRGKLPFRCGSEHTLPWKGSLTVVHTPRTLWSFCHLVFQGINCHLFTFAEGWGAGNWVEGDVRGLSKERLGLFRGTEWTHTRGQHRATDPAQNPRSSHWPSNTVTRSLIYCYYRTLSWLGTADEVWG